MTPMQRTDTDLISENPHYQRHPRAINFFNMFPERNRTRMTPMQRTDTDLISENPHNPRHPRSIDFLN